ncbi:MAG: hypothetical protein JKY15_05905, partial [Deltaproteobacteria bacterium]|nr:hypothetical protein [Deltaproteobacteria bacterium]
MRDLIKPQPAGSPEQRPNELSVAAPARGEVQQDRLEISAPPTQQQAPTPETPAMRELHNWAKAYREAEGEIGRNRVLDPSLGGRWQKVARAVEESAKHPENHDDLKQNGLEDLVRENYDIVRSESNILNPSWLSQKFFNLTGQGFKGVESERQAHVAVLRESIEGAIADLRNIQPSTQPGGLTQRSINSYIASYSSMLDSLPESSTSVNDEQREQYWKSLTKRHPTRPPEEWFSEGTRNALGVVARAAMLTGQHLPPPSRPEISGIAARVDAEMRARAAREPEAGGGARSSAAVDKVLGDLSTALGLVGPADVCFDLENLARDVAQQIDIARPALRNYQAVADEALADFGNKHWNLVRQARLIEALQSGGAQLGINVPMPEGVRTQQVHALLQSKAPEIYTKWSELGEAYRTYTGSTPFLQTDRAKQLLSEIDSSVERAFESDAFTGLNATPQMRAWLDGIKGKNGYLMVRSTGAEDIKDSANAGGNLSEAYVSPDEVSVGRSLGNVVRSYFGAGSLQNRVNA